MPLVWEDLCFRADESILKKVGTACCCCCVKQKEQGIILHNLSGKVDFGTVVALMGPSGAGKSTILKCLTQGKVDRGYSGGQILVHKNEGAVTSYICQNDMDHLLFSLTVEQSLMYASQLKNPSQTSPGFHETTITEQLTQLGLLRVRKNYVSKLSGGERKRLAVGLELTQDPKPNYLFLDEPTSGLDSHAVLELLDTLRTLVHHKQMAVITVIHQPSYVALLKFHQVFFLSKVGLIYGGSPNERLPEYITEHGYYRATRLRGQNENPADIMIRIAASAPCKQPGRGDEEDVEAQRLQPTPLETICTTMSNTYKESYALVRPEPSQLRPVHDDGLCKNGSKFSMRSLWVLLRRTARSTICGQWSFLVIRLALHAVVAITLALLYNRDIGTEDSCYTIDPRFDTHNCSCTRREEELRDESVAAQNVKFQFFSLLFLMFAALMPTVLSYPAEIKVFLNEHRNGWYTTATYYIAKTITEIPAQLIFPFGYIWFLYWYTQQTGMEHWYNGFFGFMTWRYGIFLLISILACFIAQGLGFLIGILCVYSPNISIILSSSVLLFLFLFSGFFVKTVNMSPHVSWITYLSFIKFAFEALLLLIYGYERCGLIPPPGSTVPTVPTKSSILYTFDITDDDLVRNVYWLLGHFIVIRAVAFIALKNRGDPKFLKPTRIVVDGVNWLLGASSSSYRVCGRFGKCVGLMIRIGFAMFVIQVVVGVIIVLKQTFFH